jgi:hypothetical protein
MSDTTPETPETPAAETAPAPSEPIRLPDDHPLLKTLATLREENKGLKSKAGRLDEIEEAQKTELQKAQERADAAERRASDAEAARLKSATAAKHGVPEELLAGATSEELEASAQRLLAFKGVPPTAPSTEAQGKRGEPIGSGVKQLTREDIKRMSPAEIVAAQDSGQFDDLLGVKSH